MWSWCSQGDSSKSLFSPNRKLSLHTGHLRTLQLMRADLCTLSCHPSACLSRNHNLNAAGVSASLSPSLCLVRSLVAVHRVMLCSSCSPDFGVGGVSDRLGQISPKLVFFSLGYLYGGRWHDCRTLAKEVLAQLPGT